jgi:hypothetical protein
MICRFGISRILGCLSWEQVVTVEGGKHVTCAHCGSQVPLEEAVDYEHRLLYGKHYHCRDCDPDGVWDCMSHDTDMEVH